MHSTIIETLARARQQELLRDAARAQAARSARRPTTLTSSFRRRLQDVGLALPDVAGSSANAPHVRAC